MDAYSTLERSETRASTRSAADTAQARHAASDAPGKGLSIAEVARRDLEATLQLLADRAQYITGAAGAAIALRDGHRVLCRASSGSAAPELGSCLDLNSGLSGESVRTRTALCCADANDDPRVDRESCRRLSIRSFAVMPILRHGAAVGVFEIFSGQPHAFQERDLTALERLREMVNIALDQATQDYPTQASPTLDSAGVEVPAGSGSISSGATHAVTGAGPERAKEELGSTTDLSDHSRRDSKSTDRIGACEQCGFPISESRRFCLDCEAKGFRASSSGFLAVPAPAPGQQGIRSWVITNRYVIGMILISAATIAFALLR